MQLVQPDLLELVERTGLQETRAQLDHLVSLVRLEWTVPLVLQDQLDLSEQLERPDH